MRTLFISRGIYSHFTLKMETAGISERLPAHDVITPKQKAHQQEQTRLYP
jgi:hypothetical protein